MSLTPVELARLRKKIGDNGSPPAFSDEELQDIWSETGEDWNRAALEAIEWLLADAVKLTDYTQNATTEKRSQIRDGLLKLHALYLSKISSGSSQVKLVGFRSIPPQRKNHPDGGTAEWET